MSFNISSKMPLYYPQEYKPGEQTTETTGMEFDSSNVTTNFSGQTQQLPMRSDVQSTSFSDIETDNSPTKVAFNGQMPQIDNITTSQTPEGTVLKSDACKTTAVSDVKLNLDDRNNKSIGTYLINFYPDGEERINPNFELENSINVPQIQNILKILKDKQTQYIKPLLDLDLLIFMASRAPSTLNLIKLKHDRLRLLIDSQREVKEMSFNYQAQLPTAKNISCNTWLASDGVEIFDSYYDCILEDKLHVSMYILVNKHNLVLNVDVGGFLIEIPVDELEGMEPYFLNVVALPVVEVTSAATQKVLGVKLYIFQDRIRH